LGQDWEDRVWLNNGSKIASGVNIRRFGSRGRIGYRIRIGSNGRIRRLCSSDRILQ
jgi:hypothetical protein